MKVMEKFIKSIFVLALFTTIIAANSLNLFAEVANKINGIPLAPIDSSQDVDISKVLTSEEKQIEVAPSNDANVITADENLSVPSVDVSEYNSIGNDTIKEKSKNILNDTASSFPSSSKQTSNDWKLAAFLAAIAAAGVGVSATTKKKGGVFVAQRDRTEVLKEINAISAKKYTLDDEGYLLEDKFAKIDEKGSKTASDVLDSLIISKCQKIIATSKSYEKVLSEDGNSVTKQIDGGEIVGDDSTGYVIFQEPGKVSGIGILHEMAHAAGKGDALDVENKIRSEVGLEQRVVNKGSEGTFFRELNEGEGYLEEFTQKIDGTVTFDKNTETAFVDSSGARGDFRNGEDGTYIEPGTNKFIVRQKQFRYKMSMDIDNKSELYLRTAIGEMNGVIDWNETDKEAVIGYSGQTYHVKIGDFGTRIVNDRLVISKTELAKMLSISEDDVSKLNYSNDFDANDSSGGNEDTASNSSASSTPAANPNPQTTTSPQTSANPTDGASTQSAQTPQATQSEASGAATAPGAAR